MLERAGNPSPGWEKGRDEGLPFPKQAKRFRLAGLRAGPHPALRATFSHPGEGKKRRVFSRQMMTR